ncbi:MAG: FAD-dependent oxidoreductase, partial [Leeuwenhoekiella sp.]
MKENKVIIIGGGLAGLTAAIDLRKKAISVILIEKNSYPRHKVCGEYISNEVLPYLNILGVNPFLNGAVKIDKLHFSGSSGDSIKTSLPMGGFGISRYLLDKVLYDKALLDGVKIIESQVENVEFIDDNFKVTISDGSILKASVVIGSYGKRSSLDIKLKREFITQKSPWLAVKSHYRAKYPTDLVSLHNFKGGYCGLSKVEDDRINVCYLVNYKVFKEYKDIDQFNARIVRKNPHLDAFFGESEMIFDKP